MAIGYGVAVPKGKTRKQVKARKDREDAKQLKRFQDAVWKREQRAALGDASIVYALCQGCSCWVHRDPHSPYNGHVHHVISRRHKSTRYSVANGRLLCRQCHNERHGREF